MFVCVCVIAAVGGDGLFMCVRVCVGGGEGGGVVLFF